jgi:hypothetical protein
VLVAFSVSRQKHLVHRHYIFREFEKLRKTSSDGVMSLDDFPDYSKLGKS